MLIASWNGQPEIALLLLRHGADPTLASVAEASPLYSAAYRGQLSFARELVRIDPVNETARARLIQLLARAGRRNEAKAQYESASRVLKELGAAAKIGRAHV